MSYSDAEVSAATTAMDKYRAGEVGEVGAALVVVGLSSERADKESRIRDDMIRLAHRGGVDPPTGRGFGPGAQDHHGNCRIQRPPTGLIAPTVVA